MTAVPLSAPTIVQFGDVAARAPDRLAVHDEHGPLSYAQLHHRVQRCAQVLARLGLRPGDAVGIAGPGIARQLLVALAVEGLGGITASFGPEEGLGLPVLLRHVTWVVAGFPVAVPPGVRFILVDDAFLQELAQPLDGPPVPWILPTPRTRQRLARTSGSTGLPKYLLHDRTGMEWWIASAYRSCLLARGADSRMLVLSPLVVGGAYARACACLQIGAAVLGGQQLDLDVLRPTSMFGLSAHLNHFVAAFPPGATLVAPIAASIVGGALPRGLRDRAAALGVTPLHNRYGCNECGPICEVVDADGVGTVLPGVELRILDDAGHELPLGEVGTIALRTPAVTGAYLDDPVASAAAFRDGWYVSSDAGAQLAPGVLRLVGRLDDLVVLGGVKVACSRLEDRFAGVASITGGAALTVQLDGGRTTLGVAVVLAPGRSLADAQAELSPVLADVVGLGVRLVALDRLPLLPGGKLDRQALLRRFMALAGS